MVADRHSAFWGGFPIFRSMFHAWGSAPGLDLRRPFFLSSTAGCLPEATDEPREPLFTDPVGSDGAITMRQIDSRFDGFRLAPHLFYTAAEEFWDPG